jgi:hypothetical protein
LVPMRQAQAMREVHIMSIGLISFLVPFICVTLVLVIRCNKMVVTLLEEIREMKRDLEVLKKHFNHVETMSS